MTSSTEADPSPQPAPKMSTDPITVAPHSGETSLKLALFIVGTLLWILLIISMVGAAYAIFFGVFFFVTHMILIAHIRGSSVKLGPQQMSGLYNRVVQLSERIGLKKVPDAYLLQAGGVLNAFATRFGSRNFVVLHSEMVRSCGENMDALDFIIAHELGHLHRGHLRWRWLKAPAMIVPFLGSAYYRSCEYTCDRYGAKACSDPSHRLNGLCILAAGARYAPLVNQREFVAQTKDLNTPFMKLGGWFATHPPLARRAAALDPSLKPAGQSGALSTLGALVLAALIILVPTAAIVGLLVTPLYLAGQDMRLKALSSQQENLDAEQKFQQELNDAGGTAPKLGDLPPEVQDMLRKQGIEPK